MLLGADTGAAAVLQRLAVEPSDLGQALTHQCAQVVARYLFDERCGQCRQMGLAFQGTWIGLFTQLLEEIVGQWLRVLLYAGAKGVGALGADQGVGSSPSGRNRKRARRPS